MISGLRPLTSAAAREHRRRVRELRHERLQAHPRHRPFLSSPAGSSFHELGDDVEVSPSSPKSRTAESTGARPAAPGPLQKPRADGVPVALAAATARPDGDWMRSARWRPAWTALPRRPFPSGAPNCTRRTRCSPTPRRYRRRRRVNRRRQRAPKSAADAHLADESREPLSTISSSHDGSSGRTCDGGAAPGRPCQRLVDAACAIRRPARQHLVHDRCQARRRPCAHPRAVLHLLGRRIRDRAHEHERPGQPRLVAGVFQRGQAEVHQLVGAPRRRTGARRCWPA